MPYTPTTWVEGVTKLGPTNMNHLETGVSNVTTTADAAIAKPASPASNDGLVWNGSTWVNAKLVNANIDPAAAIVYSKLSLAGGIVNNDVNASAAIVGSKLATGLSGPPGAELAYNEFISPVSVTATAEATANVVVTASAVTFDGATAVWIEFFSPDVAPDNAAAGRRIILALYDGSSSIGLLGLGPYSQVIANPADVPLRLARKITPAAATKTYSVRAYVSAGTATVSAGAGGVGVFFPGFIRITKA